MAFISKVQLTALSERALTLKACPHLIVSLYISMDGQPTCLQQGPSV